MDKLYVKVRLNFSLDVVDALKENVCDCVHLRTQVKKKIIHPSLFLVIKYTYCLSCNFLFVLLILMMVFVMGKTYLRLQYSLQR